MGKLFVIMGKSATGKDTVFGQVKKEMPELASVIPYTTRPIRTGETHGVEYYFSTEEELRELTKEGKVIECREYNTVHGPWFYYTVDDGQIDFDKGDFLIISTLEGFVKIRNYFGKDKVIPLYITVDDFTRINRSLQREQEQEVPCVAEVCRRFLADETDFAEECLEDADIVLRIVNEDLQTTVKDVCDIIAKS